MKKNNYEISEKERLAYQDKIDSETNVKFTPEQENHYRELRKKIREISIKDLKAQGREDLISKVK